MSLPFILVVFFVCCSIFVNGWTDSPNVYSELENTLDQCEDAADAIEAILISSV